MSNFDMTSINSWDFIWSFFMHKPSARSWLFQNESPSMSHVAHALLNKPLLHGYSLTAHDVPKNYSFPDVGELATALTTKQGTVLGLTFGFHATMPIVPLIYEVSKEPSLSDPSAIVRRTARHLLDQLGGYLHIECCWLVSGHLVVSTSVHALANHSKEKRCVRASIRYAAVRVFPPAEANRLLHIARQLDSYTNMEGGLEQSPSLLPEEFLNPSYKFFVFTDDITGPFCSSLDSLVFGLKNSMSHEDDGTSTKFRPVEHVIGYHCALIHSNNAAGNSNDVHELSYVWKAYCDTLFNSRRNGVYRSRMSNKNEFGDVTELLSRKSNYTFLCTVGISARGRIQRLCTQLRIHYSRPEIDNVLLKYVNDNGSSGENDSKSWPGKYIEPTFEQVALNCHFELSSKHSLQSGCYAQTEDNVVRDSAARCVPSKRKCVQFLIGDSDSHAIRGFECEEHCVNRKLLSKCASSNNLDVQTLLSHDPPIRGKELGSNACKEKDRTDNEVVYRKEEQIFSVMTTRRDSKRVHSTSLLGKKVGADGNSEIWECAKCGIQIRGKWGNLKRHSVFKHENFRRFGCTFTNCGRKFHNRVNLKRHENAVHEGRPFKCPECTRDFKLKAVLDAHIQKTHVECAKMLVCDICGNCFAHRSSLIRHRRTVHEPQNGTEF